MLWRCNQRWLKIKITFRTSNTFGETINGTTKKQYFFEHQFRGEQLNW